MLFTSKSMCNLGESLAPIKVALTSRVAFSTWNALDVGSKQGAVSS